MNIDLVDVSIETELHVSSNVNSPFLLLSHPHPVYGGSMTNKVIDQIYRRSVERDWSVLRYNMRGIGKSTGSFDKGVGEEKDLNGLIEWSGKQPGLSLDRLLLVGYSFGSWLTAKVASQIKTSCVLIAPPVSLFTFPVLNFPKTKIIFSAPNDEFVKPEQMKSYFDSISEPKTHVSIPDADHYFIGTTTALIRAVFQELDKINL